MRVSACLGGREEDQGVREWLPGGQTIRQTMARNALLGRAEAVVPSEIFQEHSSVPTT